MMDDFAIQIPALTHNPWHPNVKLGPRADRDALAKEVAEEILNAVADRFPRRSFTIFVGDMELAGRVVPDDKLLKTPFDLEAAKAGRLKRE